MAGSNDFFGSALADLYARGMDINRENPWALAASAFPMAQRSQPGITLEQLTSAARGYLQPQPTAAPSPQLGGNTPADALQALDGLGMTSPDVGMSTDTSLGGRAAALAALNDSLSPASLTLNAMGMLAGPFGPIGAKLAKEAMRAHLKGAIDAEMGIPGVGAPMGQAPGLGIGAPGSLAAGNISVTGVPTGAVPGSLGSVSIGLDGPGAAPGPGPGIGSVPGVSGGTGPGGAPGGADAGVGAGSAPGAGDSAGDAGGASGAYKKGGIVTKGKSAAKHGEKYHPGFDRAKGTHIVPIKAHEGEFVVNSKATKAARPALEALNHLIPPEGLDKLMAKGRRFFDVS